MSKNFLKSRSPATASFAGVLEFSFLLNDLLNGAGGDHVHRAQYDLPREIECGPELAIKHAERARIAPDGADGARERHERTHFVTRGTGGEEGGDLGRRDVCKGAAGRAA